MFYRVFTGPTCFPLPISLDGYFSSSGVNIVVSTSVSLTTGNYLYSTSNNEVRKITDVNSSTTFTIESAFTVDVSNDEVLVSDTSITYSEIDIINFGTASGLLNGQEYPINLIANMKKEIEQIVLTLNGTGTKMSILALE